MAILTEPNTTSRAQICLWILSCVLFPCALRYLSMNAVWTIWRFELEDLGFRHALAFRDIRVSGCRDTHEHYSPMWPEAGAWASCRMQSRCLGEDDWAECIRGLFPHLWAILSLVVKWGPSYLLWKAVLGPPCMKHSWWFCACFPCDGVVAYCMQFSENFPSILYSWDHYKQNIWPKIMEKKQNLHWKKWNFVCVCYLYSI